MKTTKVNKMQSGGKVMTPVMKVKKVTKTVTKPAVPAPKKMMNGGYGKKKMK